MERDQKNELLGEIARIIAEHDRRFNEQIGLIFDAMGTPKQNQ